METHLAMTKKIKYLLILLLGTNFSMTAQLGFSHEVGAFVGGVAFQSDFGIRKDFETNAGNTGFAVGLVHYMNFSYRKGCPTCTQKQFTFFNDHFKIRSELSYNSTQLQHFGKWANKNSVTGRQLKAMKGEAKVTDVGMQLEFYPWSIREFSAEDGNWGPFIALGGHFSAFQNGTYSELGPMDTPISTPIKYYGAWSDSGGSTWSVVSSVGTRYKLTEMSDLFAELRWQYYFSDWVDGLKPDPEVYTENKTNDWNLWLHFGYIYYLD